MPTCPCRTALLLLSAAPALAGPGSGPAETADEWLTRAERSVGMDRSGAMVLRVAITITRELPDQSDRTYAPYLASVQHDTIWLDPSAAVGLIATTQGNARYLRSPQATFRLSDSMAVPDPAIHSRLWSDWALNPWAVLAEWQAGRGARLEGRRVYRDYPRVVLARPGPVGVERLFLDERTGVPLKLERIEPHYFLGPTRVEYVYQTWQAVDGRALYPWIATRVVDGRPSGSATMLAPGAGVALIPRSEAPPLTLPDRTTMSVDPGRRFADATVDTVAAGPDTYLLVSPVFTSVATLQADTVYLLDATAGEARAERDAAWVDRLFPRRRAIVVVALNPVWPHVAGLSYWVARGATVVTPRAGAPFLRRMLGRRGSPVAMRILDDSLSLGGGGLRLFALEGINGEGVALGYVAPAGLLWATDHIQDLTQPNIYVEDVRRTVERHGISPRWTSGPHLELVPWSTLEKLPRVTAGWG